MITPSIDFLGLTVGASGRWKNCPPHTEPERNAAVSKTNVRPDDADDERRAGVTFEEHEEVAAEQRHPRHVEHGEPDVGGHVLARPAGPDMNHRNVAATPSANIASTALSPRKYPAVSISAPATSPTAVAGWRWCFTMTPNSSP